MLGATLGTTHGLSYLLCVASVWKGILIPMLQIGKLGFRLGNVPNAMEPAFVPKAWSRVQGKP